MAKTTLDTGTDELLCAVEEGVATITLNRPEKRNALSQRLTPALRQCLLELETDPIVRVVVITGAGGAFCAGGDVSGMGDRATPDSAPQPSLENSIRDMQHRQEALTLRLWELSKPTLAVLPGPAAGAGMSIALACDLRIASERAFLVAGFANIGLSGDYGGSWFLSKLIGPGRAKEIYFTGRRVPGTGRCYCIRAAPGYQVHEGESEPRPERRSQDLLRHGSGPHGALRPYGGSSGRRAGLHGKTPT